MNQKKTAINCDSSFLGLVGVRYLVSKFLVAIEANTIKVKLFRARKKLATILKQKLEPEIINRYERERR